VETNQNPSPDDVPVVQTLSPPPQYSIFVGPHGLPYGWRFAIYIAAVVGLVIVFSMITRPVVAHFHKERSLWLFPIGEFEQLIAAVIPALVFAKYEKRKIDDYGIPRKGAFGKNFWIGVIWGLAAITFFLGLMRVVGVFYFGGPVLHGPRILKFAAFWGLTFLLVGLFEEFATRGYSQFILSKGIGFWPTAVLLSAAFGALHLLNSGEGWIGALGAALIGLFFCLTLRRTGTLWFAVGMHASWDWGESYLYSVPDSGQKAVGHLMNSTFHGSPWLTGGTVGPEGSVLLFVLIAALWIVFDRVYPAKAAPTAPFTTETQSPAES
jgi:CAAX protease family protein